MIFETRLRASNSICSFNNLILLGLVIPRRELFVRAFQRYIRGYNNCSFTSFIRPAYITRSIPPSIHPSIHPSLPTHHRVTDADQACDLFGGADRFYAPRQTGFIEPGISRFPAIALERPCLSAAVICAMIDVAIRLIALTPISRHVGSFPAPLQRREGGRWLDRWLAGWLAARGFRKDLKERCRR